MITHIKFDCRCSWSSLISMVMNRTSTWSLWARCRYLHYPCSLQKFAQNSLFYNMFKFHGFWFFYLWVLDVENAFKFLIIEKSEIYDDSSSIIRFKIDIRCLYDLPNHEAGICCIEVCLLSTDKAKFPGDISKLLREGRLNTTSLVPLCRRGANDKYIIYRDQSLNMPIMLIYLN